MSHLTKRLTGSLIPKVICTHDGKFHCDEVLACWMLTQLDEYKNGQIVRTRDNNLIEKADIVVDVGAKFDISTNRFDHHQKGFNETFDDKHMTKLSSAGLVYKHLGKKLISSLTNLNNEETLDKIYTKIYDVFIESVDGVDNGVSRYPTNIIPAYQENTSINHVIGYLNPCWNETDVDVESRFFKGMEVAGETFMQFLNYYVHSWLPSYKYVEEAVNQRYQIHKSGCVIVLENFCAWTECIFEIEEKLDIQGQIVYCIFQSQNQSWTIKCVPLRPGSFVNRLSLPEPWRGIRNEILSEIAQIPNCIFVHQNGFIGAALTKESCLAMAFKSLEYENAKID